LLKINFRILEIGYGDFYWYCFHPESSRRGAEVAEKNELSEHLSSLLCVFAPLREILVFDGAGCLFAALQFERRKGGCCI
jgi:hypothetical protein